MRTGFVAISLLPCLGALASSHIATANDRFPVKKVLSAKVESLDLNGDRYYDVLALHVDVPVPGPGDYYAESQLISADANDPDAYPCFDPGRPAGMVGPLSALPSVNGHADSTRVCRFDVWFDGEAVRTCAGPMTARLYVQRVDSTGTLSGVVGEFRVPLQINENRDRFGWQAIHILGTEWQPGLSQTNTLPVRVDVARAGKFYVQIWAYEDEKEISFQAFVESLGVGESELQIPWKAGVRVDSLEIVFSTAWQPPWGETHEGWTRP
jgi:hypothetical protein